MNTTTSALRIYLVTVFSPSRAVNVYVFGYTLVLNNKSVCFPLLNTLPLHQVSSLMLCGGKHINA